MNLKRFFGLILRYIVLLVIAFPDLSLIYTFFTPLTIKPVVFLLSYIDSSTILASESLIMLSGTSIEIIPACIGGAAYFLLLTLNFTTPMHVEKRIKSIIFTIVSFLLLNVLRIVLFAQLHISGTPYFDLAHQFTWYFGSTIMVVLIWFFNVWLFNITAIPIYTDVREIFKDMTSKNFDPKKSKKKKLKRKANKILNKIENKEKRKIKKIKDELSKMRSKKKKWLSNI